MSTQTDKNKEQQKELMKNTVVPWDIDVTSPRWQWATHFITSRPFYNKSVWAPPEYDRTETQIMKMVPYLLGSRKFILCFSPSPLYMRSLYLYLAAAWALTTKKRVAIADVQTLIEAIFNRDDDMQEHLQDVDLLLLPYAEKDHVGIHKASGSISNLLMRRRVEGLPTVTDLYVPKKPVEHKDYAREAMRLTDTYGALSYELFYGKQAKYIYVNNPTR